MKGASCCTSKMCFWLLAGCVTMQKGRRHLCPLTIFGSLPWTVTVAWHHGNEAHALRPWITSLKRSFCHPVRKLIGTKQIFGQGSEIENDATRKSFLPENFSQGNENCDTPEIDRFGKKGGIYKSMLEFNTHWVWGLPTCQMCISFFPPCVRRVVECGSRIG